MEQSLTLNLAAVGRVYTLVVWYITPPPWCLPVVLLLYSLPFGSVLNPQMQNAAPVHILLVSMTNCAHPAVAMASGKCGRFGPILHSVKPLYSNIFCCNCDGGCRETKSRSKSRNLFERSLLYVESLFATLKRT